ncbi:hypothetical protein VF21_00918 [Pseudogymnoascus sp. 05NY08]|nr:hypothetical protein VF21_00918 [Pseudogymnoascus sp. 05NY08]
MSAPMIAWAPVVNRAYQFMTSFSMASYPSIDIPSVDIHDVETAPEKRARTLKHLIKANHVNFAVLFHDLQFDNHMAHILCSAYILGANEDHLNHIYTEMSKILDEWTDSPAEITDQDWRQFLGDRRYQRAYVDFFEDELALKHDYDWKIVVKEFFFEGEKPLINCVISGLGHPLIQLGYAFEFNSKEIAMEALGLAAVSYNYLHKYSDDTSYTKPSENPTTSIFEVLRRIGADKRFDGIFKNKSGSNSTYLFEHHESLVLEHWNSWAIEDPVKQFEESQKAAASLLIATVAAGAEDYDFFLVHILTTSHAVRILLPFVPKKFHIGVVRQWFLLTIAVYIGQLRPKIDWEPVEKAQVGDKGWKYVVHKAVAGSFSTDAHYVKALRALKEAASTWGDADGLYLSGAVRFADEFNGWHGFGADRKEHEH